MITSRDALIAAIEAGETVEYLFFWGHRPRKDKKIGRSCFSQWWPSPFEIDHTTYLAAEHYMMAEKALLFGDEEVRQKILAASSPGAAKKLGREVRGFDEALWEKHRYEIVLRGNLAKFGQHEDLRTFLLHSGNRILVEAAPNDRIWGIGLAADDERANDPRTWRGLNLLGFALVEARERLLL